MNNRGLLSIIVFVCFIFISCEPKNEAEIYGTYIFDDSKEREVIVLDKNYNYKWTFLIKTSNQTRQEVGVWKFNRIGGGHITLIYDDPFDQTKKIRGSKAIEKWFGKMYLGMSEGGGKVYKKIE